MIYRIDYVLALILVGAIAGTLVGRRTSQIEATRLARGYYALIAIRVTLGALVFVCSIVLANAPLWNSIGRGIGDASTFLFGALIGVTLFRSDRLELLRQPQVYSALCLTAAFAFVTTGFVKAFYMQSMTDFFTQSGYSLTFLKFIITIEVLGGVALLIPWATLPAVFGLSIDMFGAIYPHIHNGDPVNDNTGAVAMLIRLGAIAAVWALRVRPADAVVSVRNRLIGIAAGTLLSMFAAVAGSTMMRHAPVRAAAAVSGEDRLRGAEDSQAIARTSEEASWFGLPANDPVAAERRQAGQPETRAAAVAGRRFAEPA